MWETNPSISFARAYDIGIIAQSRTCASPPPPFPSVFTHTPPSLVPPPFQTTPASANTPKISP